MVATHFNMAEKGIISSSEIKYGVEWHIFSLAVLIYFMQNYFSVT